MQNLNAEQMKLLETRPFVEAGLVEHERIRSAMEAVALDLKGKEMEEAKLASSATAVATPTLSPDSINALKGDANDGISTPSTDVDAPSIDPSEESTMESVGVATDPIQTEHASAQTELSGPPPPRGLDPAKASIAIAKAAMYAAKEKEEAEARGLATGRAEMKTGLRKILGLLHATTWCNAKGKSLPTAIDFFSKVGSSFFAAKQGKVILYCVLTLLVGLANIIFAWFMGHRFFWDRPCRQTSRTSTIALSRAWNGPSCT